LCVHAWRAALLAWADVVRHGDAWVAVVAFGLALVLTNIWNFMDGIDGIAATQAVLVAGAVAFAGPAVDDVGTRARRGATLGFLPFNVPKARIFLGDVGSGALGFAIAALLVARIPEDRPAHALLWCLPISAFVIDATLTLARRVLRRETLVGTACPARLPGLGAQGRKSHAVTLAYAGWTLAAIVLMRCWPTQRPCRAVVLCRVV
jgi:UDP-N-acetylmuramyl pentapeptide phosphotransferase/UDP-N-acetylglucosamine-1-phosphate transferase